MGAQVLRSFRFKPLSYTLAAAAATLLPNAAQAECPSYESIERYSETAGDALSALAGLVPDSQQESLEARYSAMLVLKWEWRGDETIANDSRAVNHLAGCLATGRCESDPVDIVANTTDIMPDQPSVRLSNWARTVLECELLRAEEGTTADVEITEPDEEAEDEVRVAGGVTVVSDGVTVVSDGVTPVSDGTTDTRDEGEAELAQALTEADPDMAQEQQFASEAAVLDPFASSSAAATGNYQFEPRADLGVMEDPQVPARIAETRLELLRQAAGYFGAMKPALAVDRLQAACAVGFDFDPSSTACGHLFAYYSLQPGHNAQTSSDQPRYILAQELCAARYSVGCQSLARYYSVQTTPEARSATMVYTEISCELGDGLACATLADFYRTGYATPANTDLARQFLERSCNLGRQSSCQESAELQAGNAG